MAVHRLSHYADHDDDGNGIREEARKVLVADRFLWIFITTIVISRS
jgi:hypothetical protein